jgi:hypothetical protein
MVTTVITTLIALACSAVVLLTLAMAAVDAFVDRRRRPSTPIERRGFPIEPAPPK